eukprot:TRINITY_DN5370_c1_g2_i2.p2 TRINITY_DN5370_c1_g2~~TRINITY_DN5370_c1_g2_i2.p2  ORF type:complete len:202 (-),score=-19.65 TRINITY_DN5370_c1_g2_i2:1016-1621(-)
MQTYSIRIKSQNFIISITIRGLVECPLQYISRRLNRNQKKGTDKLEYNIIIHMIICLKGIVITKITQYHNKILSRIGLTYLLQNTYNNQRYNIQCKDYKKDKKRQFHHSMFEKFRTIQTRVKNFSELNLTNNLTILKAIIKTREYTNKYMYSGVLEPQIKPHQPIRISQLLCMYYLNQRHRKHVHVNIQNNKTKHRILIFT